MPLLGFSDSASPVHARTCLRQNERQALVLRAARPALRRVIFYNAVSLFAADMLVSRLGSLEAVSPLHFRYPQLVALVPLLAALVLGFQVLQILFPGLDGGLVGPIGHGDAYAVLAPGAVYAEEAGLPLGQLHHALGHLAVAAIACCPLRGEDHRIVRWLRRS